MANKKLRSAAGVAEDQLKAGVKLLQEQLATAGKLATKAKERLPAPSEVTALAKDAVAKRPTLGKRPAPRRTPTQPAGGSGSAGSRPDDSWTVADLKAEAKRRGMTGYSRKTKDQLLRDLRG